MWWCDKLGEFEHFNVVVFFAVRDLPSEISLLAAGTWPNKKRKREDAPESRRQGTDLDVFCRAPNFVRKKFFGAKNLPNRHFLLFRIFWLGKCSKKEKHMFSKFWKCLEKFGKCGDFLGGARSPVQPPTCGKGDHLEGLAEFVRDDFFHQRPEEVEENLVHLGLSIDQHIHLASGPRPAGWTFGLSDFGNKSKNSPK